MRSKETQASKETKKRIEIAKYQLEVLQTEARNPRLNKTQKDAIQKQINVLKDVYSKTMVDIYADGSVKFKFKGNVNVEDFKKAFNIKDGSLRTFLSDRHCNDEYLWITDANINGRNATVKDYDDSGRIPDPNDKLYMDFYLHGEIGSYVKYNDGYKETMVKRFFGGTGIQSDYTEMSINSGDSFKLDQSALLK